MNIYQIIVSNVGTVYDGRDQKEAYGYYEQSVDASELGTGRSGGETVTMMEDGEVKYEHVGMLYRDEEKEEKFPPHPSEGLICCCEDAPCCGCYSL
jgi:hypothetical protein